MATLPTFGRYAEIPLDQMIQTNARAISTALIDSRYIARGLYERAVKQLSNNGVSDLTVLIGYFTMVALTLMFHDVPSGAEGLKR
ncbi:MAG TPA: hypothetical protein VMB49_13255 [Acidobacteriaceae bacterium]|nr:hypothetical protein [Acidobacteriaceae bacterium]